MVTEFEKLVKQNQFFVPTTDGAGVAAISILDKEHCNQSIRGHFSAKIFYLGHEFDF